MWIQEYWPFLFTVALPFVIAAIAKAEWSSQAKSWLALGLSAVVGVVGAYVAGIPFTPANLVILAALVRTGTQVAYDLFKRAGITNVWLDELLAIGSRFPEAGDFDGEDPSVDA